MKLNEYRIGNIINYQYKGSILQGTITSISKTKVTVDDKISLKLNSIIPIPLTEDAILKFERPNYFSDTKYGFIKTSDIISFKVIYKIGESDSNFCLTRDWQKEPSYHFGIEYTDSPNDHDNGIIYNFAFEIKYVHQLQNLWIDIVHEELKYDVRCKE